MNKPSLIFRGPVTTASGYGVHARQLLRGLLVAGEFDVHLESIKWGETPHVVDDVEFEHLAKKPAPSQFDVSVQVTIPNEFKRCARMNVGVTAGIEVDVPSPQWLLKINREVDVVVVPSTHSRDTLAAAVFQGSDGSSLRCERPVVAIPEGVDVSVFNTTPTGVPGRVFSTSKNFLYVGLGLERGLGEDRKNVSQLVRWFCEAFKGDEDVGLVLKTAIVNSSLMDYETTAARIRDIKAASGCGQFPKIHLVHGRLEDLELAALYKHPSMLGFVTLTHGEGFGLPIIEAAACGLPVIATDWSGHVDFLHIDGRKLFVPIEHDLKPVPESVVWDGVIERGTRWAHPREESFKTQILKVRRSPEKPREWAAELAGHIARNYDERLTGRRFAELVRQAFVQFDTARPTSQKDAVSRLRERFKRDVPTLLFTMPMSAGDVYLSTGVVASLKKKFPGHRVVFATSSQYRPILEGNTDIGEVIDWEPWMQDVPFLETIFDEVYTPNLAVQMVHSNWVHGGKGRNIADEMASACLVELDRPRIDVRVPSGLPEKFVAIHTGAGVGQWSARNYRKWQEVASNVAKISGLKVVQVGTKDEPKLDGVVDWRGRTKDYRDLAGVVSRAACVVGIDSVTMHLAAGLETPHVAIFGSSYASSTGTGWSDSSRFGSEYPALSVLIDAPDRLGCQKACYKHECAVDKERPCVNTIDPREIVANVLALLGMEDKAVKLDGYVEVRNTISGYTHLLDPTDGGYPWVASVKSMLGFCDEVVVVDGGSKDGTREALESWSKEDPRLKIYDREWDWSEPGMDGMQKAYARAMCTGKYLWQQDADEVVHARDFEKIKRLVERFPMGAKLLHLPVVELWGDDKTCRTDRHAWKWRLSRGDDFTVTHGIVKQARLYDEKTGKTYAKKGQSDGCEYIDAISGEYVPHVGFWNNELEALRQRDPAAYGRQMNAIFAELPSVFHFSWQDLPRKIANFKKFWNACWANLYRDPAPEDRFSDVDGSPESVARKAEELRARGGEHGQAMTFRLELEAPKC